MTWHRAKVAAGSDGEDVSDFDEVQQGSDPTDASDHGIVQGETVDLTLQLSGGYASTHLGPVQLEVGRIRHRQPHANASYADTYHLRQGVELPVQMTWLPGANTWNDWCQSCLTVNNQAFAPTAMDGRYVAGNAILDDPSGVFACGYGDYPWYDPPPTATLSMPQLRITDFSGNTLPEGICVPSNSMVILNACVDPQSLSGSYHWSITWSGFEVTTYDQQDIALPVADAPLVATVFFTPDGCSNLMVFTSSVSISIDSLAMDFTLPSVIRLNNDDDDGNGQPDTAANGGAPNENDIASGGPCFQYNCSQTASNLDITVTAESGGGNVRLWSGPGNAYTLPSHACVNDAPGGFSIEGISPSASIGDVSYRMKVVRHDTGDTVADITQSSTVLRVALDADFNGDGKIDSTCPTDPEKLANTNLMVYSGTNLTLLRVSGWLPATPPTGVLTLSASTNGGGAVRVWSGSHITDGATCLIDTSDTNHTKTAITWNAGHFPVNLPLWVQGVSSGAMTFNLAYTGTCIEASASLNATIIAVNLRIDSTNGFGTALPPYDPYVDAIKDRGGSTNYPGKIIYMNDMDVDGDGIPDFLDGFGVIKPEDVPDGQDQIITGGAFIPLVLTCPLPAGVNPNTALLEFVYDANNPSEITTMSIADATTKIANDCNANPFSGKIRIWTKDASQHRNAASIANGGDFVPIGSSFQYTNLVPVGVTQVVLYAEGIGTSDHWGTDKIKVKFSSYGPGFPWCEDQVSYTVVRCVYKVCAYRPYICVRNNDYFHTIPEHGRFVYHADYSTPYTMFRSYLKGQCGFDDTYHKMADYMGHGFAQVEWRVPGHCEHYWTGQTGLDPHFFESMRVVDVRDLETSFDWFKQGTFYWFRAGDGVENKSSVMDNIFNKLYIKGDKICRQADGNDVRLIAVREFRIMPNVAANLCHYREQIHPFAGYGLDTVLAGPLNAPLEYIRNSQQSRAGCGTYVSLLTQYAGVTKTTMWTTNFAMPIISMTNISECFSGVALAVARYRLGPSSSGDQTLIDLLNHMANECTNIFAAAYGTQTGWPNSGIVSNGFRRLHFTDPAFIMDWIDGENASTEWKKEWGVAVRYDSPDVNNLQEWRSETP